MKLLNLLLKRKKPEAKDTIGSLWLCAANFAVHNSPKDSWHDVVIKEVGITHAEVFRNRDGTWVESAEDVPLGWGCTVPFRGRVGRLAFNEDQGSYFVGFFETEEEAETAYRGLAKKMTDDIAAKMPAGRGLAETS